MRLLLSEGNSSSYMYLRSVWKGCD